MQQTFWKKAAKLQSKNCKLWRHENGPRYVFEEHYSMFMNTNLSVSTKYAD